MSAYGSVLTWGHRVLTIALEMGSRRTERLVEDDGRPVEGSHAGGPPAPSPASQPPSARPATGPAPGTVTRTQAQARRRVPAHPAATVSVPPAVVRRWAHEQGIQVADRGRIPQSLMEQYLAQTARPAAGSRQSSRAPSKGARRSSGRSRSPAA